MKLCRLYLISFLLLGILCSVSQAYAAVSYSKMKAVYVYNLSNYISWPESALGGDASIRNICVGGDNEIKAVLKHISKKKTAIKVFDVEDVDVTTCHIVYTKMTADKILSLAKFNILVVSDVGEGEEVKSMVGFMLNGKKIKLIVNISKLKSAGLSASSKLLQISEIIEGN